jgi:DNA-binding GntR family transcriptional regulator
MVDMGKLDPDDSRPPFIQLADALRAEIQDGTLGPGSQLPSYSALSADYGVAPNTVKSALAELRQEGLIVSRQGKGSFVRTQALEPAADDDALAELRQIVALLADRLAAVERRLDAH